MSARVALVTDLVRLGLRTLLALFGCCGWRRLQPAGVSNVRSTAAMARLLPTPIKSKDAGHCDVDVPVHCLQLLQGRSGLGGPSTIGTTVRRRVARVYSLPTSTPLPMNTSSKPTVNLESRFAEHETGLDLAPPAAANPVEGLRDHPGAGFGRGGGASKTDGAAADLQEEEHLMAPERNRVYE